MFYAHEEAGDERGPKESKVPVTLGVLCIPFFTKTSTIPVKKASTKPTKNQDRKSMEDYVNKKSKSVAPGHPTAKSRKAIPKL